MIRASTLTSQRRLLRNPSRRRIEPDRRLRAAGLPNGTRNYPDADRRIMRGYQARAPVGRGSLCIVLFTDWGRDGRRVSSLPRIPAQQRPPCLGSLPPGRVSRFQDVVSTGMISISSSTRPSVNGGRVVRPLSARSLRMSALTVPVRRVWPQCARKSRIVSRHGYSRSTAISARRSPPSATAAARSAMIFPGIVDRPRRPACRRPEPRSRPARDSRSGARVSIGPRTADAHRSSAAGTNTCSGAAVSMTIAAPRCRPGGSGAPSPGSRRVLSVRGSRPWRPLAADSGPDSSRRCRC